MVDFHVMKWPWFGKGRIPWKDLVQNVVILPLFQEKFIDDLRIMLGVQSTYTDLGQFVEEQVSIYCYYVT